MLESGLSEQALQTLLNDLHTKWIEPELSRRQREGRLSPEFRIRRALIKLPAGVDPIVTFNDEVEWTATVVTPRGKEIRAGDPVHLQDVDHITSVERPKHEGAPVAFFFLFWNGLSWQLLFDCAPNLPDKAATIDEGKEWSLGPEIAGYLNHMLREYAIHNFDLAASKIDSISLWAAPALLPYPMSAIAELCENDRHAEARSVLVDYCNQAFLVNLVESWNSLSVFALREKLFKQSLDAHSQGHFVLSVSALIPHIEGVITDWMYSRLSAPSRVSWRQKSKTKQFRDMVAAGARRTYVDQRVADSVIDFVINGPVLETFEDWLAQIGDEFPNRHVVGHGRFDERMYTQENSIKLFLILDTLFRVMAAFEASTPGEPIVASFNAG